MSERVLPYSEEAEKGVLGCLLLEGERVMGLAAAVFGVTPEAFYVPQWRTIAEACWGVGKDGGRGIDILTVTDFLRNTGTLDAAGGIASIEKVMDGTPTASHAEYYVRILRDKWLLRKTISAAREIEAAAFAPVENVELFAAQAPEKLMGIVNVTATAEPDNGDVMDTLLTRWKDAKAYEQHHDLTKKPAIGYETPWAYITRKMSGLESGLTIIGGRPSAGKTTLEDILSHHVAQNGIPVGRITLDSSRHTLLARAMCREAEVSLPKLKGGYSRDDELQRLEEARQMIMRRPIKIRTDLRDIASIRMWALNEHRRNGMGMLTVDYIQQVTAAEIGWQAGNALARTTHVIGQFKSLAMELQIPVLVLSQLSRPSKERKATDPQMSDLRDSGALEQDADKILLLSIDTKKRDEMDEREAESTKTKRPVLLTLAKNKDGIANVGIEMWLLAPYFKLTLAEPDWTDDEMPAGHRTINGPEYQDHQAPRPQVAVPHLEDEPFVEGGSEED